MFGNVDEIIVPADVARTGSGAMAGAQPLASGAVGMAAGGDGRPLSLRPSHPTSCGPVKFSLLFPCALKFKNLKLELIES